MLPIKLQETIVTLYRRDTSIRQIERLLKVSRRAIRRVLRQSLSTQPSVAAGKLNATLDRLLPELYPRCKGNAVRIHELLKTDYRLTLAYSTVTKYIRDHQLRGGPRRAGEYHFQPGEEMQHDTSPHKVTLGQQITTAHCASLVLAYSRRLFIKYYPRFTRFEAKCFLNEAIQFMGGAAKRCVIDNSSVVLASGAGDAAVIAPEMKTLLHFFGAVFKAHAVGHPDRKARVERPFHYIETNFLVGRDFRSWEDLNQQALAWCCDVANQKVKRALGTSPQVAYQQEKAYLVPLPSCLPPIYDCYQRLVDSQGYVNLHRQRYSVPQALINQLVSVYEYEQSIEIYLKNEPIATHPRLTGKPEQRSRLPGHHRQLHTKKNRLAPSLAETTLRGEDEVLDRYIDAIKKNARGKAQPQMRRLLNLQRTYPKAAFMPSVQHALHYRLYDLHRLEKIILKRVAGNFFNL